MSTYHCSIKIISRAGGRSAVASAAYRSGEKLYNDETGIIHDFTYKVGVIMNEIILPENAPERYHNREILWNEVQQVEKRSDAQFAREIEVALPIEMSREEQIECTRKYIKENFVDKGMIADWALHDKTDGNPHAHIMLTMRGIDEYEEWLKNKKQYLLMLEMNRAEQSLIQSYQYMIQRIEKIHLSIVFQFLMKMENKKREFVKVKVRNICGRRFLFHLMIGMIIHGLNYGDHRGQIIVINIWIRSTRLTIEVMRDKV